ncbi:C39 family peptidase [Nocardioides sp. LHG3406-4]|uniref:C39 family peptidase n=1 Tax=Nocardioides sp. LHG3406-4 TaxID=2804575 RepID=UPI003CF8CF58
MRHLPRALVLAALVVPALTQPSPTVAAASRGEERQIAHTSWTTGGQLRSGDRVGVKIAKGSLKLRKPAAQRTYLGKKYESGSWTSAWAEPGFALTELIPSWQATTPGQSWVEVKARVRTATATSSWDVMGRWTSGSAIRRTSAGTQTDDLASVLVDTLQTAGTTGATGWQLKVTLLRAPGSGAAVSLDRVGAVASRLPATDDVATSAPGPGAGTTLDVPAYSQMVHAGHYPQWGGGGEAWCSPTSVAMVLGYRGATPAAAIGSAGPGHPDPMVDYAARMTYDHGYDGTGNWAFNTAYAGRFVPESFVTRLRSLREAEDYIAAGTPLVVSVAFGRGELTGAPISSTPGHLMVIVGFTSTGDVVVNDPAAPTDATVRRTYRRAEFEDAWIPTSGGTAYVIR